MPTTLQTLRENVRATRTIVKGDLQDKLAARREPPAVELDERQRRALAQLRRDGYAVIEDYWPRERALEMRDKLEAFLEPGVDQDFEEGAWLRFWDARKHDQGVRRLYHVEKVVPELAELRFDRWVLEIATAYYGVPFHSGLLMFQHNIQSNEHTRYYHVDAFIREFKSFVYLDDVDEGNGPFAYIPGSQKHHFRRLRKQVVGNPDGESPTSFYPEELGDLLELESAVCGPAGTMILADVRGLHRGTPQVDRSRSALVNYIVKHEGDLVLDK
jgi:Phytanoyl-CoA dioxygenase (PhyH)